jgi:hypothetical protein
VYLGLLHKFFFLSKIKTDIVTSSSSEWKEELEIAVVFAVLHEHIKKSTRSCWVHDINKKKLIMG